MTNQTYLNIGSLNFLNVFKKVALLLFFSLLMTLLFQIYTTGLCHSKASLIWLYNLIFWGVVGYKLFEFAKNRKLNLTKSVLIGLGIVITNQIIIGYAVEYTMLVLFDCGSFSPNWISYSISNNALINLLCFVAFTASANLLTKNNAVVTLQTENLNVPNEVDANEITTYPEEILIKDGFKQIRLAVTEIRFVEVEKNCITLHTHNGRIVLYQSLKSFSENLNPDLFVKSHRSFLVNVRFVEKIINLPSGDAILEIKTGEKLKVSRTYKPHFVSKFHAS
ncbi:MAG: LytTR family transcriptional regulator [Bacteroidetes bacterium]|nr:MAG: LytTR family transcriptional regulator [Bacteroidota bacterium]